ncbi:uncharacterized protein LOC115445945 [Manduca sexta]|uniref:uncharacterized protein LOC115445945 n=1 Tax=Manduca sexta TaxID=7130 RepID=UPI00188F4B5E|nr:uncharacterized protein LOC115445945 [Manduca sexta]
MDHTGMASGDNSDRVISPRPTAVDAASTPVLTNNDSVKREDMVDNIKCTPQMIEDNETKLKDRIAQCKNIIDSLKLELNEEKNKLEKESKTFVNPLENVAKYNYPVQVYSADMLQADTSFSSNMYSACIESKLNCDENLIEYEKQLQKYQNTLNLAQTEKKNAIRKQMLAKAYRLKLLEIENQCNVELLRVKQSLQCLEPLKIIANKWKSNIDNNQDYNSFDLIPRYPEINVNSGIEINSLKNLDTKIKRCEDCIKINPQ